MPPGILDVGPKLLLTRVDPRVVMLLGDTHALMAEQDGDTLEGNAPLERFHFECIPESVRECTLTMGSAATRRANVTTSGQIRAGTESEE
jgi:hypothetical protein